MAKENNKLDQFFKEKLGQDSIKPSKLAWERLESQLPPQEKRQTPFIWWSVAASIAALIVVGYFAFTLYSNPTLEPILASTAENQTEEVIEQAEDTVIEDTVTETVQDIPTQPEEKIKLPQEKPANSTIQKTASNNAKAPFDELISVAEDEAEIKNRDRKTAITPDIDELNLPTLNLLDLQVHPTIAKASPEIEEEPSYRIKIYSDGLEENKTFIGGINKKVEQVEGLLEKVDQGFADLQDAKNNLFTALLTKKEKVTERP